MKRLKIGDVPSEYLLFPFYHAEKELSGCFWGMTTILAGSMRFRWDEQNEKREKILSTIANGRKLSYTELLHGFDIHEIKSGRDVKSFLRGDGFLCFTDEVMPVVTVADCVPIFLFVPSHRVCAVLHSGWKGTGILGKALEKLSFLGISARDIFIAIGAHIRDCCYVVDEERADFFVKNFTKKCVSKIKDGEHLPLAWKNKSKNLYRLSLEKANLSILERFNIPESNISILSECTCCNALFGSNRRETAKGEPFTVQAAFVYLKGS